MRWLYLGVIALFTAATIIFAFQNLQTVTVSFFRFGITAPLAILVFVVYGLGALTGGGLIALLRQSYRGSRHALSS